MPPQGLMRWLGQLDAVGSIDRATEQAVAGAHVTADDEPIILLRVNGSALPGNARSCFGTAGIYKKSGAKKTVMPRIRSA
jgi:hypothetical protein